MPVFVSGREERIWDATAVSNAFIGEYMPQAPAEYVKVYLYGLMMAHSGVWEEKETTEDVAALLNLTVEEVHSALRYWERNRLLDRVSDSPASYRFLSAQRALLQREEVPADREYEAFSQAVYAMFEDKRKLHGGETGMAFEWVEQMKLPPEVVLMLLRHMIRTRGVKFSFKEAQKIAAEMSDQKVDSIEAAETFLAQDEAVAKGTKKILYQLGMHRSPTEPEKALYTKWTHTWNFTPEAVLKACDETVSGSPSFAYLDKILEGLYTKYGAQAESAEGMTRALEDEKTETAAVRELLQTLGIRKALVDVGIRSVYREMAQIGGHDLVLLAAQQVAAHSANPSLERVQQLLTSWQDKGMTTVELVNAYLQSLQAQDAIIKGLLKIAGQGEGRSSQASRALLAKWREEWQYSDAVLSHAAECVHGRERPLRAMDALLTRWHEAGAQTLEQIQALPAASAAQPQPTKRVLPEQTYTQRDYHAEDFEGLSAAQIEELNRLEP